MWQLVPATRGYRRPIVVRDITRPSLDFLEKAAKALGISPGSLWS